MGARYDEERLVFLLQYHFNTEWSNFIDKIFAMWLGLRSGVLQNISNLEMWSYSILFSKTLVDDFMGFIETMPDENRK